MPREWTTKTRDPWNAKIHAILKTIDLHTELYIKTGDVFHNLHADHLRRYVLELKNWIHNQEQSTNSYNDKT